MYTEIKNFLASFSFKPFGSLFWGRCPSIQPDSPFAYFSKKGQKRQVLRKNCLFNTIFKQRKNGETVIWFKFSYVFSSLSMQVNTHSYHSSPYKLSSLSRKQQSKRKFKVKEEIIFISMAFFCFSTKNHYFDFSGSSSVYLLRAVLFMCLISQKQRKHAQVFLLHFLARLPVIRGKKVGNSLTASNFGLLCS